MTINQLLIKKLSDDRYEFVYYKSDKKVNDLPTERSNAVRFIDDAVDAMLRLTNIMDTMPESGKQTCVVFEVGDAEG